MQFRCKGYPISTVTCTFVPHIWSKQLERISVESESRPMESTITNISLLDQHVDMDIIPARGGEIRCIANNSRGASQMAICVENKFFIQSFGADAPIRVGQEVTLLCIHSDVRIKSDWYLKDKCIEMNAGEQLNSA